MRSKPFCPARCDVASELLILIMCFLLFFGFCRACPNVCVCKWKNGKQTADCDGKGLLAIPKGIEPETQVLNFSRNNIPTLTKEKFLQLDLIHLQKIYLMDCQVSYIDETTFRGLTNLVELDLSRNSLTSIPSESFSYCPAMMKLLLNYNPIKVIRRNTFDSLYYLQTLELNYCEIVKVEQGAFVNLNHLEWLLLAGNKITTIESTHTFPQSLKGLELHGNPWECNCHLVSFHFYLQNSTLSQSDEPLCSEPSRLSHKPIKSVQISELACLPEVVPTTFYLEILEGKNVSLTCQVRAIPEAQISWLYEGQVLQNDTVVAPGMHLIYYLEKGPDEKNSKLFIFNANVEDNGTFVCSAENSAGTVTSNYTLRIVIKRESQGMRDYISFEYILIIVSALTVFALMILILAISYAIRTTSSRNRRRKSKRSIKKDTISNSTKDSLLPDSKDDSDSKNSLGDVIVDDLSFHLSCAAEEARFYLSSPAEQNPDLINHTETATNREDGTDNGSYEKAMENEIELHPPIFFPQCTTPIYHTLPHKRVNRQSSLPRLSMEAPDNYCPGVRHTKDGYQISDFPSPPDGYKSEPVINWPHCVPADLSYRNVPRNKCVGAQTEPINKTVLNMKVKETLTESPNEDEEEEETPG